MNSKSLIVDFIKYVIFFLYPQQIATFIRILLVV